MLQPYLNSDLIEAGCDEAGRGCLAGAVYAAAVILPKNYHNELLNDSKQLTEMQRKKLRIDIEQNALSWSVASIGHEVIDSINILNASILAMNHAVRDLKIKPEFLLIDGNRFKNETDIKHLCVVKGDAKYMSIAAASILAKTYRDEYMNILDKQYPQYGWKRNKAYATQEHRDAIIQFGISPLHRKSFNLNFQTRMNMQ